MISLMLAKIDPFRSNKTGELLAKSREQRSCWHFSAVDGHGQAQDSSRGALAEPGAPWKVVYTVRMMYISDHV